MNYYTKSKWEVLDLCGNILEPYTCRFCEFATNFRVDLQKHVGTCTCYTHDIEAVLLTIPEFEYAESSTEETKQEHGTRVVKQFNCHHCNYGNDKRKWFINHLRNKHKIGRMSWYHCDQCSYKCPYKSSLGNHKSVHHTDVQWYTCTLCDYETKFKNYLIWHRIFKHVSDEPIQWFPCDQCDYKANTRIAFHYHKRAHEEENWLKCDQCEYKTPSRLAFRRHLISKHANENQVEWIRCKQCDFRTKLPNGMRIHEKRTHGILPDKSETQWYNCAQCNFRAKQKSGLREHQMQMHHCHLCKYRAKSKSLLNIHIQSVHEEKKSKRVSGPRFIKCEYCPMKQQD